MSYINNNILRQISFLVILIALGLLLLIELTPFLPAVLGALAFFVLLCGYMRKLVEKKKWPPPLAASLLLLISFVVVVAPLTGLVLMLSSKVNYAIQNANAFFGALQTFSKNIEQKHHIVLFSPENIGKAGEAIANILPGILGATFNLFTTLIIMYFILYFMLVGNRSIQRWLEKNIPLKRENFTLISKELNRLTISSAIGIPLIALLQGLAGLVGYLILGVKDPFFWFVVTSVSSMIPFVGSALAYVPVAVLLIAQGDNGKGIIMLLYGFLIIGTVDNVFRIILQKKIGDIHPIITIFGVIVGVKMFGFVGLIFGPIIISMFLLLVKVYVNEFSDKEVRRQV